MEYCGIDIHQKTSEVCVINEQGEVVGKVQISTTEANMERWFGDQEQMLICIEAGGMSAWVERILRRLGHRVVVANPGRVRLIAESTLKNDKIDAETLARLVRMDVKLLHPIQHRSEHTQKLRGLLRARNILVTNRTSCMNGTRGMLRSMGYRLPGKTIQRLAKALVEKNVPEDLIAIVAPLVETGLEADEKIAALDKQIEAAGTQYPEAERFQAIPGVGPLISLAFILCIEDPTRFSKSRDVGGFLGLRPKMRESGGKSLFGGITHTGDTDMRRLLVQAAHGCLRSRQDTDLKRWGLQLAARVGKNKAVVGLARKIAIVMHHMWITGEAYEPLRNSYAQAA